MAKVLYIKANPKTDQESVTFQMSQAFIWEYMAFHPQDEIITMDLYNENLRPLESSEVNKLFGDKDDAMFEYAKEFATADKYIVAAPMWNLSIPSILKSYIDYVVISGITFKYTEKGPVGLLEGLGKKVAYISSRGGFYSEGPAKEYDLGEKYLRTIFSFMGVKDFQTIFCEKTAMLKGHEALQNIHKAVENAKKQAASF